MEQELITALNDLSQDVKGLKDLFTRRLMNDRQKNEMIQGLEKGAAHAYVEPVAHDLILLLDRIEGEEDVLMRSVQEELLEILERQGICEIGTEGAFDPKFHRAVKAETEEGIEQIRIIQKVRKGYMFYDKVMRPADVIVAVPEKEESE